MHCLRRCCPLFCAHLGPNMSVYKARHAARVPGVRYFHGTAYAPIDTHPVHFTHALTQHAHARPHIQGRFLFFPDHATAMIELRRLHDDKAKAAPLTQSTCLGHTHEGGEMNQTNHSGQEQSAKVHSAYILTGSPCDRTP